jgi:ABC-type metal ion transport system substrate-binding protein
MAQLLGRVVKISIMKKIVFLLLFSFGSYIALPVQSSAQTEQKVKVKKTSTPGQKVANTFRSKSHKKYKGVKVKEKIDKPSTGS